MISIDEVKDIAGRPDMTDADAEELRSACYSMAELVFELWLREYGRPESEPRNHPQNPLA